MALFIVPNEGLSCGDEESSRNCPARTCESCSSCYGLFETGGGAGMKTIYKRDLPPVSLDGWQVTVLQLIFPTGSLRPSTFIPGSFSATSSRENFVFTSKVSRRHCCRLAMPSMKRRAPSICLLAARAPPSQPGFWLWLSAKKERN
jgi:hypothetical protein